MPTPKQPSLLHCSRGLLQVGRMPQSGNPAQAAAQPNSRVGHPSCLVLCMTRVIPAPVLARHVGQASDNQ